MYGKGSKAVISFSNTFSENFDFPEICVCEIVLPQRGKSSGNCENVPSSQETMTWTDVKG